MPTSRKIRDWSEIRRNPTLHRHVLVADALGADFPWHDKAHLPQSSQAFCVSAFGALRSLESCNQVISGFLTASFPEVAVKGRPRQWKVGLEASRPDLLGEHGRSQPTSIDVLCESSREVVCVESKFLRDASDGFGGCSQASGGACKGFFGPGSDARTKTPAWCRLETWDGDRSPRLYWTLGRRYFKSRVFEMQRRGGSCPFKGPNYQLMRNFLFAASYAVRAGKGFFAVLALCPRATSGTIESQLNAFRDEILRPEYRKHVKLAHYEDYIAALRAAKDPDAHDLGDFLSERIATLIPAG
jgi:hypothetical protein